VVQLYPRTLGSLYVASYDSQGYGEGILTLARPGGPDSRIYIPPGTEWSRYTPEHWVPFTSPLTTRMATVKVF
jgi:hypothetical protein